MIPESVCIKRKRISHVKEGDGIDLIQPACMCRSHTQTGVHTNAALDGPGVRVDREPRPLSLPASVAVASSPNIRPTVAALLIIERRCEHRKHDTVTGLWAGALAVVSALAAVYLLQNERDVQPGTVQTLAPVLPAEKRTIWTASEKQFCGKGFNFNRG
mmetsp:Transcript_73374/g.107737  ORF Transcript_73374/g.107737 Transcript_73374/m.107737 type:complete len:159 (-) Transcript_73374:103-579(-)